MEVNRRLRLVAAVCAALLCACAGRAVHADDVPAGPFNASALYPEGPLLFGGALYYAEMTADRITRWDDKGRSVFFTKKDCGPTSISPFGADSFAVTCHLADEIAIVSKQGKLVRSILKSDAGARLTLPNDSYSDRQGGVYFSSSGPFAIAAQPSGRVFHLKADGSVSLVAKDFLYSNGVFVTASGLVYVSEHMGKKIWRFRIGESGRLEPLGVFADVSALVPEIAAMPPTVGPDGLEVTGGGTVFVAIYGSGKILQISAVGTLQHIYDTGLPFVTNMALDLERNRMIVTGAFSNTVLPYEGEVREIPLKE